MSDAPIVFVDTLDALEHARTSFPGARVLVDNPLLAHDPGAEGSVEDISRHLGSDEGSELGHRAIDMLMALDDRLTAIDVAERFGGRPGALNLTLAMRSLLATLMQRGVMMARALKAHGAGPLHILTVDRPTHHETHPWSLDWFADPYRPLARHGFFGTRKTNASPVPAPLPNDINDTSIADTVLRAAILPLPQLAFEIKRRMGLSRLAWRDGIRIGKPNEALRETLPWLAARGFRLEPIDLPAMHRWRHPGRRRPGHC